MPVTTTQNNEEQPLNSNQNGTLSVPKGGKITSFCLHFKKADGSTPTEAEVRAEIGNIRLTLAGQDVINADINQILDFYESLGNRISLYDNMGVVELNFGKLLYISPALRDAFGFGTKDIPNIQVQISAKTLSAIASVQVVTERLPVDENLGTHCRFIDYKQSFTGSGKHTVDTLPRPVDQGYLSLLISDGATGVIKSSELKVNTLVIREDLDANVNKVFNGSKGVKSVAGYYNMLLADGDMGGILPMKGVNDIRVITDFSNPVGADGYSIAVLSVVNMPVFS